MSLFYDGKTGMVTGELSFMTEKEFREMEERKNSGRYLILEGLSCEDAKLSSEILGRKSNVDHTVEEFRQSLAKWGY